MSSRSLMLSLPILLAGSLLSSSALAAPVELDMFASSGFLGPRAQWVIIEGLQSNETVTIIGGTEAFGDGDCPAILDGTCVDLDDVEVIGTATADSDGAAILQVPMGADVVTGQEQTFQAVALRGGADEAVVSNPVRVRATDNRARLRVLHASPDTSDVDIYVNGVLLFEDGTFGEGSLFATVAARTYTVDVRPARTSPLSPPVYSTEITLEPNQQYTAIATGLSGSIDPAEAFRIVPLVEEWGDIDREAARVRVVHAGTDAPTVAVDVGNDGSLDIPSLPRFGDTGNEGIALPAETPFSVGIKTEGGDAVTSFSVLGLPAGGEVTVVALGELAMHPRTRTGFSALALFRDGTFGLVRQDPTFYTLHASPDAPRVDVRSGGATLASGLGFRELSAPIQVPPGVYDIDVADSESGAVVASAPTPPLVAGERYLATATGFVGGGGEPFQLVLTPDVFRDDGEARVILVHASPDGPPVDFGGVGANGFMAQVLDVDFGQQTQPRGIQVDPGLYDVGVAVAGDPVPSFVFPGVSIDPASRGIYLATGSVNAFDFAITTVDTLASPWEAATLFPR